MSAPAQSRFENWIFDSFDVTSEGLGLYRIFSALFYVIFLLPSPHMYAFMSRLPDGFYLPPPGPMQLFGSFPSHSFFLILHGLLILCLVCLLLGFMSKWSSIGVGLLFLIIKGFTFSLGKINHEMLIIMMPLVMAFSGWGQAYSLDARRNKSKTKTDVVSGWPLVLLALIMGFMFFTAGFPKLIGGWLNINTHAAYSHYLKEFLVRSRRDFLAPWGWKLGYAVWQIGDYLTVFFEIGFLVAIFHPKSTRIFVSLAVLFHLSTMLLLNISFLPDFVAYAAFINWSFVDKAARSRLNVFGSYISTEWRGPLLIVSGMIGLFILSRCLSGWHILASDWGVRGVLVIVCALPVALSYLGKQVFQLLKRRVAQ